MASEVIKGHKRQLLFMKSQSNSSLNQTLPLWDGSFLRLFLNTHRGVSRNYFRGDRITPELRKNFFCPPRKDSILPTGQNKQKGGGAERERKSNNRK